MAFDPRIPKSVKIGGVHIAIEEGPELVEENNLGAWSLRRGVIKLRPEMAPDVQCSILLHEILHVINSEQGWGLKEQQINQLAFGIFQVLSDNDLHFYQKGDTCA